MLFKIFDPPKKSLNFFILKASKGSGGSFKASGFLENIENTLEPAMDANLSSLIMTVDLNNNTSQRGEKMLKIYSICVYMYVACADIHFIVFTFKMMIKEKHIQRTLYE